MATARSSASEASLQSIWTRTTHGRANAHGRENDRPMTVLRSDRRAVEVLERPRRRRAALSLVAGAVLLRAVGVLRGRGEPEEAELTDLHPRPQLDRQGRHVGQLKGDVAREAGIDEPRRGVGEEP